MCVVGFPYCTKIMSHEPRSTHYITSEEAELLFCFRLLKTTAQAAVIALIASQMPADRQEPDTSVKLSLVSNDRT